ncbi:assimilatory nitrate reductase catalytic subunit [Humitalea rosea]|uniref:Assimilatory nitrate reductase catalytic subunit n=1 Tax=Humitalea rosea TaxID=990373 RepID=A0A2W7I7W6_9PROT|nr:molybdopterin-dependent oxidoreductase [Humitalea rosea]PZW43031.1 assimilatory nitrate reductase catalytic subunit [Humitalea rosea]
MDGTSFPATRTTCPYCGVGCGVLARPSGPIAGDPAHPANQGRLCSKGAALGETLDLPDRQLFPEVDGKRASWDAALDAVAEGFRTALAERGPEGVALYVSGQLLTEDYYAANKFAKGVLGTANIDSNSRLCMASAVAAHTRAWGEDVVPGCYEDIELADLVVLVGSNLAWCHPVLHQRLLAARAARPEMQIVVIDPRRTATAEGAELHLPLRPGSDVALFAALLTHLADQGHDAPDAAEAVSEARRIDAPALTGLDPALIARFCTMFAATERVVTLFSMGVNQSVAGADKANAIINCHLLTGRIGKPGAAPFSLTGQPNAMGGREVGALATMLAGHLRFSEPAEHAAVAAAWGAPALPRKPGMIATEIFAALGQGRIGALWTMATNPAVSLPGSAGVRAAMERAPLLVASDVTRASDSMVRARIRLPALSWGEKSGTVTNSERVISRQRGFLTPPGEARPDWWAIAGVAARFGRADAFGWTGPADIFREHAALTGLVPEAGRIFDISSLADLSDAAYDALAPLRWGPRRYAPARARLVPTPWRPPANMADAVHPVTLLTGRLRDQWHTMTRTGPVPRLMAQHPAPKLALHPEEAAAIGAVAQIEGQGETALVGVTADPGLPHGVGFLPMHWSDVYAPSGRSNPLVPVAVDPVSGQPELKHAPVRVSPWPARWFAAVVARVRLPDGAAPLLSRAPLPGGLWRHDLAGQSDPAEGFAALRRALDAPGLVWRLLAAPEAGLFRGVAFDAAGAPAAWIALAREAPGPGFDWLAAAFAGGPADAALRRALLAGQAALGPPPSPTICACHGVSRAAIEAAITAGAETVAAVGGACAAGTGCGACRPEIAGLLAAPLVAI